MEARLGSNMNKKIGYHLGKIHPKATIVIGGERRLFNQVKKFDSLWLMKKKNNTPAVLYIKINKSDSVYHCMTGFINMQQGETDPINTFKLRSITPMEPWISTMGTTSSAENDSPRMGIRKE